ncbi:MAG: hypothetical protein AAF434_08780 [Pseudomonadota bacterium]
MIEFFLHFFPLLTIFSACVVVFLYATHLNTLHKIEKHMLANRPTEWEKLGKPSVFGKRTTEQKQDFQEFMETESAQDVKDTQITSLWDRAKIIHQRMVWLIWFTFGIYIFTIFAVRWLEQQLLAAHL